MIIPNMNNEKIVKKLISYQFDNASINEFVGLYSKNKILIDYLEELKNNKN